MDKKFYLALHDRVLGSPLLLGLVRGGTRLLPGIVYVSYPLMLLYLLIFSPHDLLRGVLVPLAGFLLCTVIRKGINAPRPYESMGIPAVTPKETSGKSFPSRHAACGSVIALTALFLIRPLGIALLVISLLIPLSRVLAGVHYIRDVLAGWALGAIVGLVGMLI